ncbi:hypothetical protein TNIN_119261 [Trichonephila inaurata madagascariensis]|uniref:Uncharacterized protein n=1 Tax=Trichonephila inaurata madagascariensis TaxID=2747483 RepID=A0A8X6XCK5_9ARAC|nr:hypothetical protein TNIN_119261 [Trichonephila inaurata madagascariensis]
MEYDVETDPDFRINGDRVLFLGSRETLHGLLEDELNFCFKISYPNGRASNMVLDVTNINLTDCDLRYDLLRRLSEDMGEMFQERYHAFCEVISTTTPERRIRCVAHQSILWKRIPFWEHAFTKVYFQPACYLPVHTRALHGLLRYVYTGILERYSLGNDVLEEIRRCYSLLGFHDLEDYFNDGDD